MAEITRVTRDGRGMYYVQYASGALRRYAKCPESVAVWLKWEERKKKERAEHEVEKARVEAVEDAGADEATQADANESARALADQESDLQGVEVASGSCDSDEPFQAPDAIRPLFPPILLGTTDIKQSRAYVIAGAVQGLPGVSYEVPGRVPHISQDRLDRLNAYAEECKTEERLAPLFKLTCFLLRGRAAAVALFWALAGLALDGVYSLLGAWDLLVIKAPGIWERVRPYICKGVRAAGAVAWWSVVAMAVALDWIAPRAIRAALLIAQALTIAAIYGAAIAKKARREVR